MRSSSSTTSSGWTCSGLVKYHVSRVDLQWTRKVPRLQSGVAVDSSSTTSPEWSCSGRSCDHRRRALSRHYPAALPPHSRPLHAITNNRHSSTPVLQQLHITINFTRLSVTTEVGALYGRPLSADGWEWPGRGRHTLRCQVRVAGWAWSLHEKQT